MNLEQKRKAALRLAALVDSAAKAKDGLRTVAFTVLGAVEKLEDFLTEVEKQGTDMLEKLALDLAASDAKDNPVADVWRDVVKPGSVVDFSNGPVQVDDESRVMPDGTVQLYFGGIWYDKSIMIDRVINHYNLDDTEQRRNELAGIPNSALINAFSITQEHGDDGSAGREVKV